MIQRTLILDTNVYGELLVEHDGFELIRRIKADNALYIYGVDKIEHELHDVPSDKKIKGKIFREMVLSAYRSLVDEELVFTPLVNYLTSKYYEKYRELRKSGKYYALIKPKGLKYDESDLKIDFGIIAVASLKGVDIVVSADKRTMMSGLATATYDVVNKVNGLRTPALVDYFVFRKRYLK